MMRSQLKLLQEGSKVVLEAVEVLQQDLEVLRKCSIDNPDYKVVNN